MNDDYLWDKTGEPDPQIQQLEEILGTLRHQPQPLRIPQELLAPRRRRNHWPLLAIAASVLLALLAAGVWLRVRNGNERQPQQAQFTPAPKAVDEKTPAPEKSSASRKNAVAVTDKRTWTRSVPPRGSGRGPSRVSPTLTKREREEALAAKEQLMLALRLASEKLNLIHRKTQSPPANQIKNQHRVG